MQDAVLEKLIAEFSRARKVNPAFSLRAFARRMGVQASALSELMNGQRKLTRKMAARILQGLGASPVETTALLEKSAKPERTLNLEHFKVISEWHHFAILSLAETKDFSADPEWIARRLNIPKTVAAIALKRLLRLEMLVETGGRVHASGVSYNTPTDILNASLKNHTLQTLELAKESLFRDPIDTRDFSTVTVAIDPANLPKAKKMIAQFRKKLSDQLEEGNKSEVYKIAVGLFPLSHTERDQ